MPSKYVVQVTPQIEPMEELQVFESAMCESEI